MTDPMTDKAAALSEAQSPIVHLDLALQHHIGSLSLDVTFQLSQPWTLLFAPSGAGKTTILRAIAGLLKPQQARIVSYAQIGVQAGPTMSLDLVMTDTSAGLFIPPHQRAIGMISQNAALFPHLNVLENIRYGAAMQRQEEEKMSAILALCRAEHLTPKMPTQLSSGERQRVALARALAVPACNLLLLDEPFTALDATLRDALITDLRAWLARQNTPVLSVTHDIAEAFQLNAEVLKLREGRIIQQGPAAEVLAEERSRLLDQLSKSSQGPSS